MEIELLLVVAVLIGGIALFAKLRGSRPDAVPIVATSSAAKRSPKKTEPRRNVEKWDAEEKAPRDQSPGKKSKKRFDPVKAGEELVRPKQQEVRRREVHEELTEEEQQKREQKRRQHEAQGFVVVDEKKKKKPTKEVTGDDEPAAPVQEKSQNELMLEKLQALRDGVFKKKEGERKDASIGSTLNAKKRSMEEVERLVAEEKGKIATKSTNISGFRVMHGAGDAKRAAPWAPVVTKKEEATEEPEAEPEPEVEVEAEADEE